MKELEQRYIDILEENDWNVSSYTEDGRVEIGKYSPVGEDFYIIVEVENFTESVRDYANGFDADEHAYMWIEARGSVGGVPNSIRELIEDAEAIQEMLNVLANELELETKYRDVSCLARRIFDCISDGYDGEEYKETTVTSLYNELSQIPSDSSIKAAFISLCERIEELEE